MHSDCFLFSMSAPQSIYLLRVGGLLLQPGDDDAGPGRGSGGQSGGLGVLLGPARLLLLLLVRGEAVVADIVRHLVKLLPQLLLLEVHLLPLRHRGGAVWGWRSLVGSRGEHVQMVSIVMLNQKKICQRRCAALKVPH